MQPGPAQTGFGPGGFQGRLREAFRGTLVWYTFLTPPALLILVFIGYPTLLTFRQSFFTETPAGENFVGLFHFQRLFASDVFWGALGNTVLLGVAFLAIILPVATIFASM